jgi:predicted metal-binding membrane protein
MLLMFAAGAMNAVWMALLGLVMTIEKIATTPHFSRVFGVALAAAGLALMAAWGAGVVK